MSSSIAQLTRAATALAAEARANGLAGHHQEDAAPATGVVAFNLPEFLAHAFPPRRMMLTPVLPEQGLAMVHAMRGVGKTYVGLGMAYAVASATSFLRWRADEPRRVVYIDGEMPGVAMQERLEAIVQGAGGQPPEDDFFRLVTPDLQEDPMPDLASPEGQDALAALVADADLLVLDNLSTLCRSGKENEAESWGQVQEWLLTLRKAGKSVLLIHHAGKSGQQRGTSKREDVLDTVISLRRPEDYRPDEGARFEVHLEKARGVHGPEAEPFEVQLVTRYGAATWTMQALDDVELARVVAMTGDGLKVRDIAAELSMSTGKVAKLQGKARAAGKLDGAPKRGGPNGRHFDGTADGN